MADTAVERSDKSNSSKKLLAIGKMNVERMMPYNLKLLTLGFHFRFWKPFSTQ
jgi:hypothetical protein